MFGGVALGLSNSVFDVWVKGAVASGTLCYDDEHDSGGRPVTASWRA